MFSEPASQSKKDEGVRGVMTAFTRALGSTMRHLQALLSLAGCEARDAAIVFVKGIVYVVIALIAALLGYILFLLALAFSLYMLLGISWIWILLGLAVLHFGMVIVAALRLRSLLRQKLFSVTMQEIRADIAGLTTRSQKSEEEKREKSIA